MIQAWDSLNLQNRVPEVQSRCPFPQTCGTIEHMNYRHLRVHSQYTLLGATPSIDDLVARAVADGLGALALTDTNALYGTVGFAKSCAAAGIQPLIGMALTVQPPADGMELPPPEPLLLLAQNPAGYRSLCRLSSAIQNHPDREDRTRRGLAWDNLRENREGLLAIAGGRRSWLESLLRAGDERAAGRFVGKLAGLFDEKAYLALEIHRPGDGEIARQVAVLGTRFGLASLAVQPVYTLEAEDRELLHLLAAMERNCRLEEVPLAQLPHGSDGEVTTHWLSAAAMQARFADFPSALAATAEIAALCAACLPDGRPIWPIISGTQVNADEHRFSQRQSGDLIRQNPPNPQHPRSILRSVPVLYMGLGQVQELTSRCVERIVAERVVAPFADLRDILLRVAPQPKELEHTICCGGLDGLGASRAELLHAAADMRRSGHAGQMGFGFLGADVAAESAAERLAWETELLGQPLSAHPVALAPHPPDSVPLADLPNQPGKLVTVTSVRLPG